MTRTALALLLAAAATPAIAGLKITPVGKKYTPDPARVVVKQGNSDPGGSTSIRNIAEDKLVWKESGYFQRNRDLGQVFTAPRDFRLDAVVLRTGPSSAAVLEGAAGAELFLQFFEVVGTPRLNDNNTPPGTDATHGFTKNHRADDFIDGVTYTPIKVVRGGTFPAIPPTRTSDDGKLVYLRFELTGGDRLEFQKGKRYAFMVGFAEPGPGLGMTFGNHNTADKPDAPSLTDKHDRYHGGWGLRREGDGTTPPTMAPGPNPPTGPGRDELIKQALLGTGDARFQLSPTTDGYPDVDTYRDLEFYLEVAPAK